LSPLTNSGVFMELKHHASMQENIQLDTLGLTSTLGAVAGAAVTQVQAVPDPIHFWIQIGTIFSIALAIVSWSVRIYKDWREIRNAKP